MTITDTSAVAGSGETAPALVFGGSTTAVAIAVFHSIAAEDAITIGDAIIIRVVITGAAIVFAGITITLAGAVAGLG